MTTAEIEKYVEKVITESSYLLNPFQTPGNLFRKPNDTSDPLNTEENWKMLGLVTEEVPYYHSAVTTPVSLDQTWRPSTTRDPLDIDMPSFLSNNEFWHFWALNAWGELNNDVLLLLYNQFRWPVLSENTLFGLKVLDKAAGILKTQDFQFSDNFTYTLDGKTTESLASIIKARLDGESAMINYRTYSHDFVKRWLESLERSGKITADEVEFESLLYRSQDVRQELMRRKLAGTQSLYRFILHNIGREGSAVSATEAGFLGNGDLAFLDSRLVRLQAVPFFTSTNPNYTEDVYSCLAAKGPYDGKTDKVPDDSLVPLYYNLNKGDFSSLKFYTDFIDETSRERISLASEYRAKLLKTNQSVKVNLNSFEPETSTRKKAVDILTLDSQVEEEGALRNRALDDSQDGKNLTLDQVADEADISMMGQTFVVDIDVDRVLFNENILQQNLKSSYPYVVDKRTGNSLSLIDSVYSNYLNSVASSKSRVQDALMIGAQLPVYHELLKTLVGEYYYFSLTDWNLYFNVAEISAEDNKVVSVTSTLVTTLSTQSLGSLELVSGQIPFIYRDSDVEINNAYFALSDQEFIGRELTVGDFSASTLTLSDVKSIYYATASSFTVTQNIPELTGGVSSRIPISAVTLEKGDVVNPFWRDLGFWINPEMNFNSDMCSPLFGKEKMAAGFLDYKGTLTALPSTSSTIDDGEVYQLTGEQEGYIRGAYYKATTSKTPGATEWPLRWTKTDYTTKDTGKTSALCNLVRDRHMESLCNDWSSAISKWATEAAGYDLPESRSTVGLYLQDNVLEGDNRHNGKIVSGKYKECETKKLDYLDRYVVTCPKDLTDGVGISRVSSTGSTQWLGTAATLVMHIVVDKAARTIPVVGGVSLSCDGTDWTITSGTLKFSDVEVGSGSSKITRSILTICIPDVAPAATEPVFKLFAASPVDVDILEIQVRKNTCSDKDKEIFLDGSLRENYSHSKDIYNLALTSCAKEPKSRASNIATVREVISEWGGDLSVKRSNPINWAVMGSKSKETSIIYDNFPADPEELDATLASFRHNTKTLDPIEGAEISLIEFADVFDDETEGVVSQGFDVKINGTTSKVGTADDFTCATPMFYAKKYDKQAFHSEKTSSFDESTVTMTMNMPEAVDSSDGNLKYECDVSPALKIRATSSFTRPLAKGSNVEAYYSSSKEKPLARLVADRKTRKEFSTQNDYIVLPITVPSASADYTLDRFTISGYEFSDNFRAFLEKSNYYCEVAFPNYDQVNMKYSTKWDALRVMKEGTYYFTCKYPFKLMPLRNNDISDDTYYPVFYASTCVRVVVSGTPKSGTAFPTIETTERKYWKESIDSTLTSELATFEGVQREMSVKVSCLDRSGADWAWKDISDGTSDIPLFFQDLYTTSVFTDKTSSTVPTTEIRNVEFKALKLEQDESLHADRDGNVNIKLVIGKSYRLVLDMTAKVSESAYTKKQFTLPSSPSVITADEYQEHARLTNLTGNKGVSGYMYVQDASAYKYDTTLESSFDVSGYLYNGNQWQTTPPYYGDPYCCVGDSNHQVRTTFPREESVVESFWYPCYSERTAPFTESEPMNVLASSGLAFSHYIDEVKCLGAIQRIKQNHISSCVQSLMSKGGSLFSGLSTIWFGNNSETYSKVPGTAKLYALENQKFSTSVTSSRKITTTSVFGENEFMDQNFLNSNCWTTYLPKTASLPEPTLTRVSDTSLNRYVHKASNISDGTVITLAYDNGGIRKTGEFEFAISVKKDNASSVKVVVNHTAYEMTAGVEANGYVNYSYRTAKVTTDKASFQITKATSSPATTDLMFYGPIARCAKTVSDNPGMFTDLNSNRTSMLTIDGSTLIYLSADQLVPVQFEPTVGTRSADGNTLPAIISDAINNTGKYLDRYKLTTVTTGSKTTYSLVRSWVEHLVMKVTDNAEDADAVFHKHEAQKDSMGVVRDQLVALNTSDMYTVQEAKYEVVNRKLKLILKMKDGLIAITGTNICVDNASNSITLNNEVLSMLTTCLDPKGYKNKEKSIIGVNTIQLLSKDDINGTRVVYEIEFLPLVYDEKTSHLSLNFLAHRSN